MEAGKIFPTKNVSQYLQYISICVEIRYGFLFVHYTTHFYCTVGSYSFKMEITLFTPLDLSRVFLRHYIFYVFVAVLVFPFLPLSFCCCLERQQQRKKKKEAPDKGPLTFSSKGKKSAGSLNFKRGS